MIKVSVGIIRDEQGNVLVALRPEGRSLAGLWEFPGGKREAGETAEMALHRELQEEIGVFVEKASFFTQVTYQYESQKTVLLSVWVVEQYKGTPCGREGQLLRWVTLTELKNLPVPAANRLIAARLL